MATRASIRWPLYASGWAFIALTQGVRYGDRVLIVIAAIAMAAFWGTWATEGRDNS